MCVARLGGVAVLLVRVACGGDDSADVVPTSELNITAVTPGVRYISDATFDTAPSRIRSIITRPRLLSKRSH